MLGRIYYLYILLYVGGNADLHYLLVVLFIDISAECLDKRARLCSRKSLDRERIGDLCDLGNDEVVDVRNELTASLVIELVAVVLGGIVRCGDHNAAECRKLANREGKLGGRSERLKHVRLDTVCSKNACGLEAEFDAEAAVIVRDDNTASASLCACLLDILCKALSCLADHIFVDTVGSDTQNAAKSAGTKLEIVKKSLLDLLIVGLNSDKLFSVACIKIGMVFPFVILVKIVHLFTPIKKLHIIIHHLRDFFNSKI